jgi:hypothetical protein
MPEAAALHATEDVAAADHHADLHAETRDLGDLGDDAGDHVLD